MEKEPENPQQKNLEETSGREKATVRRNIGIAALVVLAAGGLILLLAQSSPAPKPTKAKAPIATHENLHRVTISSAKPLPKPLPEPTLPKEVDHSKFEEKTLHQIIPVTVPRNSFPNQLILVFNDSTHMTLPIQEGALPVIALKGLEGQGSPTYENLEGKRLVSVYTFQSEKNNRTESIVLRFEDKSYLILPLQTEPRPKPEPEPQTE